MNPEQQPQPDYDFIMNAGKQKRSLGGSSNNTTTRIILVAGGFFILLIVFIVFKDLLSSGSINKTSYFTLLSNQSEIIHIMNSDVKNQNSQNTSLNSANQSFSQTALLTMNSYQAALVKYMKDNGVSVSASSLTSGNYTQLDSQFTAASTSANFNSVFENIMSQQLTTYRSNLNNAYANASGPIGRALLQSQYKGTQLLIRELNNQYS